MVGVLNTHDTHAPDLRLPRPNFQPDFLRESAKPGVSRDGFLAAAQPDWAVIDAVICQALREDLGSDWRDLTAEEISPDAQAQAQLVAKAEGRLAGVGVFARVFELCSAFCAGDGNSDLGGLQLELLVRDGEAVVPKQELARIRGSARALLIAERTALNLSQRMSGVATLTHAMVTAVQSRARLLDTRKTTPGLRTLEKYAVTCGGGENHRIGLFDQAMVKENHLALSGRDMATLVRDLRNRVGADVRITAEATNGEEADAAVRGGADVVMLDNMTPLEMGQHSKRLRALSASLGRRIELEASGGVTLETIADVAAASDVDRISVGALTHSAPALDLSLYLQPCSTPGSVRDPMSGQNS